MGLLACLAVSLYFLIPRAPQFTFDSVTAQGPPVVKQNRIREPFSLQLIVDSTNNYLALRIQRVDVMVVLQQSTTGAGAGGKIADNEDLLSSFMIEPRTAELVSLPMRLDYRAPTLNSTVGNAGLLPSSVNNNSTMSNSTDIVFQELVKACTPINQNSVNSSSSSTTTSAANAIPGLAVVIHGQLHIWGLSWIWKPSFDISVEDLPCPVNAPKTPVTELPPGPPTMPPPPAMASPTKSTTGA
jgi:hypothetical protein